MVTREVHRSSLRRLICPAQDHFIFFHFQLHCDVSVGYTSASVCLWFCQKKLEKKRRLDNAVAGTSKIRSFFVTTIAGEGVGTSTTWTGSSEVRPDARQPDGSRSLSARRYQQREWKQAYFLGNTLPCTFRAMEIERQWFCFSPTMKKPSRQSCRLLVDPLAMQKKCVRQTEERSECQIDMA